LCIYVLTSLGLRQRRIKQEEIELARVGHGVNQLKQVGTVDGLGMRRYQADSRQIGLVWR